MILILVASAFALSETQSSDENELCNYIIQKSNIPVGTKLPGIFMQYKNDNFNVYTPEGDAIGHLAISNGYVAEFDCNLIEKPNYDVTIKSKETVDEIIDSENQVKALSKKLSAKEVTIKGFGLGKKFKGTLTRFGIKIAALFS